MHTLEPHYIWRNLYIASEDKRSPFYGKEYSEFEFTHAVYNYLIHPQWDEFGSNTLYLKILYVHYDQGFAIIEMIGEWNDLLYNDIMYLKRNLVELMMKEGINKFILVGENVMNFHADSDDYYQEWFDELEEGWIALVNFREHVLDEFKDHHLDYYIAMEGELNEMNWRVLSPLQFYKKVDALMVKRLSC